MANRTERTKRIQAEKYMAVTADLASSKRSLAETKAQLADVEARLHDRTAEVEKLTEQLRLVADDLVKEHEARMSVEMDLSSIRRALAAEGQVEAQILSQMETAEAQP